MSDHYCCKRCGLRYDDCSCAPRADPVYAKPAAPKVEKRGNLRAFKPPPPLPSDTVKLLDQLIDDIQDGRIDSLIVAWVKEGNYEFLWPSSLIDSMTLATLAQASAVDRMRR